MANAGFDKVSAIIYFNLASLATWRDIAMLAVIHRGRLGKGPPHFRKVLPADTGRQLKDPRQSTKNPLINGVQQFAAIR